MKFFALGFGVGILAILAGWFLLMAMGDPAGFRIEVLNDTDNTIRIQPMNDGDPQTIPPQGRRVLSAFERATANVFRLQIARGRRLTQVEFHRDQLMEMDDFRASVVVTDSRGLEASVKSNTWVLGREAGRTLAG